MIDKKVLQMHFSRNAVYYDKYANVQKKMANELLNMGVLDSINKNDCIDILDIGCGTGYLTEQLLSCYPNARITAVDIASGMIEYAREKFKESNIEFLCLDIEEAILNRKYDLIISNATFQWFNDMEGTIEKLGCMLKDNGVLAFSTFGHMTFNELHFSYKIARNKFKVEMESLPSQKFFKPEEIHGICSRKLKCTNGTTYEITSTENLEHEHFETVWSFLESVKKIGANNSNRNRKSNTALTREMIKTYESMFKEEGHIKATYHCVFLTARKTEADLYEGKLVNAIV